MCTCLCWWWTCYLYCSRRWKFTYVRLGYGVFPALLKENHLYIQIHWFIPTFLFFVYSIISIFSIWICRWWSAGYFDGRGQWLGWVYHCILKRKSVTTFCATRSATVSTLSAVLAKYPTSLEAMDRIREESSGDSRSDASSYIRLLEDPQFIVVLTVA